MGTDGLCLDPLSVRRMFIGGSSGRGFIDKDGACRMFNIEAYLEEVDQRRKGRLRESLPGPNHARVMVYRVEDVGWRCGMNCLGRTSCTRMEKRGDTTCQRNSSREERGRVWGEQDGVGAAQEREGRSPVASVPGEPKLYKVEEINRMLDEYGRWAPPYPDPDRPGVYRVPLSGREIKRREAIIDADALPLIEGCSCNWSTGDGDLGFVALAFRDGGSSPLRRVIMGIKSKKFNVRHVNGDGLDCRRENLVVRTIKQRA